MTPKTTNRPRGTLFTTGEVAVICRCSARTACLWFDAGHVKGFRMPGGLERRITVESLRAMMLARGMPAEWLSDWLAKHAPAESATTNTEAVNG